MRLSCRRCSIKHMLLAWFSVAVLFIIYTEFYTYAQNKQTWLEPKCINRKECTKILLVADPQIIGDYKEFFTKLTPITIFDSDMYLKKTYWHAFNFVKPDIVIFLGDLMDEGSKASDEEFYGYVRRVFKIFLDHEVSSVKHIWLPGDNDIGGEGFDGVVGYKIKRFERAFKQSDLITYKNVTYFKINRMTQTIPVFKTKREFYDSSKIFVALSHLPLIFIPSLFVEKVFDKMMPHVMFTAHEHKSMVVITDAMLRSDRQIIPINPDNNAIFEYSLGVSEMYEFIVPTCSYRMGTDRIGYGFAVLEKNDIRYTVLWSPSRFSQLTGYLLLVLCLLSYLLSILICLCCRKTIRCLCYR